MSSSTSSQWIPTPFPISRHFARCAGVALSNRGNQAKGADTRRPSASVTTSSLDVQITSTASASGLLAKVLIPSEDKLLTVLRNERVKLAPLRSSKTARFCQGHRFQPKLRVAFRLFNVDVTWLSSFSAEKKEPKAANPQNLWHGGMTGIALRLYVVIHRELVRVRAETQGVVFLLFHLDPVRDEVGVKDVAFEEEIVVLAQGLDRAAE
jgi:hypothetical protein